MRAYVCPCIGHPGELATYGAVAQNRPWIYGQCKAQQFQPDSLQVTVERGTRKGRLHNSASGFPVPLEDSQQPTANLSASFKGLEVGSASEAWPMLPAMHSRPLKPPRGGAPAQFSPSAKVVVHCRPKKESKKSIV